MISADYWYHDSIGCMHLKCRKHLFPEYFDGDLKELEGYTNWNLIQDKLKEITTISIDVDCNAIFQAGGYSKRGMYCDLYDMKGRVSK